MPAAEDIIRRGAEGEEYHLALPVLAGMAALDAAQPDGPLPLDEHPLRSALAFYFARPVASADPWYRRVVRSRPAIVADVLRRHGAAALRKGSAAVAALDTLARDEAHREVAARAALPLLRAFPTRCRNAQVGDLTSLLWAALRWADRSKLSRLIEQKLGARSMNDAQRTPWLAAGLVTAPERWRGPLEAFVQGRDARIRQLAAFFVTGDSPCLSHFQVPVEIKKDSHRDLWSAMREQLLAHYTQDPATDGYGVYLVFWFGADGTPPPPDNPPPRCGRELERRLSESLSAAEARRIAVRVIDVAAPAPRAVPDARFPSQSSAPR